MANPNIEYKRKNAKRLKAQRVIYEKNNRFAITTRLKDRKLKNTYGITRSQYNLLLGLQEAVCAICHAQNSMEKPLNVDHCHKTGNVRGLLCGNCNRALGLFKDDPNALKLAIEYLS